MTDERTNHDPLRIPPKGTPMSDLNGIVHNPPDDAPTTLDGLVEVDA